MISDEAENKEAKTYEPKRELKNRHVGVIMSLIHKDTNGHGGYGWLADEVDGSERFFHKSWIEDSIEFGDLYRGQRVTFLPVISEIKGKRAIRIRRIYKDRIGSDLDESKD